MVNVYDTWYEEHAVFRLSACISHTVSPGWVVQHEIACKMQVAQLLQTLCELQCKLSLCSVCTFEHKLIFSYKSRKVDSYGEGLKRRYLPPVEGSDKVDVVHHFLSKYSAGDARRSANVSSLVLGTS